MGKGEEREADSLSHWKAGERGIRPGIPPSGEVTAAPKDRGETGQLLPWNKNWFFKKNGPLFEWILKSLEEIESQETG